MKTLTVTIDDRDWWTLAGHAERDGLKTEELLTRMLIQSIRTQVGGKNFDTDVENLWGEGLTDGQMSVALDVTRARVADVRRRLGLTPNKGK
jgi:hypothetical protein